MTRHQRQIEDSPLAYAGPHEWMREARNLAAVALVGIAAVGSVGVYAYETTKGSHPKKQAEPATDSPYPNTTFTSNINLSVLPYVTDKAGPLPDTSFNFGTLRADEVDSSAICKTPDNKYVSEPEKTIVIYKSNVPKEGFKQVWPSLGEQTALANVTLYSHEFPKKFSGGGRIGTPKADRLATEVKQDLCVGEGTFTGYKDQHITPVLPEADSVLGNLDITPKFVIDAAVLTVLALEVALLMGTRSDDPKLRAFCSKAFSSQGKLLLKGPTKLRDRLQGEAEKDENDDEIITLPEEYVELVAQDALDGPHQDWGVLGRERDV